MKQLLEEKSRRQRDRYLCREEYEWDAGERKYRNGYYERDYVTRFGTLRLRITPAMAAGVSAHVWEIEEIVGLLKKREMKKAV